MWFEGVDTGGQTTSDAYSKGQGFLQQLAEINEAFSKYVVNLKDMKTPMENMVKAFTHMEDSANALSRSMGGVIYTSKVIENGVEKSIRSSQELQNKLVDSFKEVEKYGASFDETAKTVAALATGMGRIVDPSKELIVNMVVLQKTTNMTADEVGSMVTDMIRFGGTQLEATETMHDLAEQSRRVGINTKSYMKEVSSNMKLLNGFGFKTGVEGIKQMAKEALGLRSSIEKIGATKFQNKILEPEGAIQAASEIQMLGGAVGKLADPFQLMYMAQSDMAGLQTEMLNATKAAFKFNKETGGFEASTEDLYRLRKMAEATGADFDGLVEAGREAQKLDYIKDKFDLGGLSEEKQGLIASLAQIDKGGKVTVDLPGYEAQGKEISEAMKDPVFIQRLEEYQKAAGQSEKEIAASQLSLAEQQLVAVKTIENAVVLSLSSSEREKLYKTLDESNKTAVTAMVKASEATASVITEKTVPLISKSADLVNTAVNTATGFGSPENIAQQELFIGGISTALDAVTAPLTGLDNALSPPEIPSNDLFVPSTGQAPKVMAAGKLYKGIVGDDVAMGTNLGDALNKSGSAISGKIDVNINVNGTVAGDSGNITSMFNDPKVQKQIMDTVLYKLDMYKKQQGVI